MQKTSADCLPDQLILEMLYSVARNGDGSTLLQLMCMNKRWSDIILNEASIWKLFFIHRYLKNAPTNIDCPWRLLCKEWQSALRQNIVLPLAYVLQIPSSRKVILKLRDEKLCRSMIDLNERYKHICPQKYSHLNFMKTKNNHIQLAVRTTLQRRRVMLDQRLYLGTKKRYSYTSSSDSDEGSDDDIKWKVIRRDSYLKSVRLRICPYLRRKHFGMIFRLKNWKKSSTTAS